MSVAAECNRPFVPFQYGEGIPCSPWENGHVETSTRVCVRSGGMMVAAAGDAQSGADRVDAVGGGCHRSFNEVRLESRTPAVRTTSARRPTSAGRRIRKHGRQRSDRAEGLGGRDSRLKRLVADLSLDNQDPQGSKLKKVVSPVEKKVVIETLVGTGRRGISRACRLFGLQGP